MKRRQPSTGQARLRAIGEDSLLEKLSPFLRAKGNARVIAGSGDDAAIVAGPNRSELLVLKTDCVVEGVHFHSNAAPKAVGWKAMMRTLSDFAALSAVPEF